MRAESDGQIEDVEDQLFRFSRILDAEPRLITLLSDYTTPLDGRISLLNNVLHAQGEQEHRGSARARRSNCCTASALTRPSANWRISRCPGVARSSHTCSAASELSDAQSDRLTEVLTRIYGHPVSLQLRHRSRRCSAA